MAINDWINVISDIGGIAGALSDLFGERAKDGAGTSYAVGPLVYTNYQGTMGCANTGAAPLLLSYCVQVPQTGGAIGTLSEYTKLDANQGYDATTDLNTFLNGNLSVSPLVSDADTGTTALNFAIRAIAVGALVSIASGITASFSKTVNQGTTTYSFSVNSTGPSLSSGQVSISGPGGTKFNCNLNFQPQAVNDGLSATIELPSCLSIDPLVSELDLLLNIDTGYFQKLMRKH